MTKSPSAFRPLDPPRNLTGELTDRLAREITTGNLAPNDRLPTEQEMMATFGVSRTVVREAIAALRAEGLVESRQGAGIFVAADMSRRPFRLDAAGLRTLQGVIDLMELRMSVEIEAAGLAAERAGKGEVAGIERALGAFGRAVARGDEAVEEDYLFHLAITQATRNHYFRSFIEYLGRQIIPRRSVHIAAQGEAERKVYLTKVLAEHERILEAVAAKDSPAARLAMREHLSRGRARYLSLVEEG